MGKIVREGSEALTGGEVTTVAPHLVGLSEAILAQNTDPRDQRGATTRNGRSQFGSNYASDSAIDGLRHWNQEVGSGGAGTVYTGASYLIGRIGTTFYDFATGAHASIGIGGTSGEISRMEPLNNVLCVVVDGLTPKQWDGTNFASLTGSPPAEARYAAVYSSKLMLAGDDANPQTLYFSGTNNPNNWTGLNDAGSITSQDGGGDTIQGLCAARKWLCIHYRYYTEILTGNSVFNFSIERLLDRGLPSKTGYATAGEVNFFASDDAIYMVAGGRAADITTGKMKSAYQNISDKSKVTLGIKGDLLLVVDYGADVAYACYYKKLTWAEWTTQGWKVLETSNDQILYAGADGGSTTQIWKLDTGSLDGTSTITAAWRTANLAFGAPDTIKSLAAIRAHAKPGLGTVTITYYKNGASTGSTTDVTFAATGDHDWAGRIGQRSLRGHYLGVKFSWAGPGTLYGYAIYAEVTAEGGELSAEI